MDRLRTCRGVEQGQAGGPECATEAHGHLGDPYPPAGRQEHAGLGNAQPRQRQQTARMRPREPTRSKRRARRPGAVACHGGTEEDPAARIVRTYRADAHYRGSMDREGRVGARGVPLPVRASRLATRFHATVREDREALGDVGRPRPRRLRHALHAPNEGDLALQADEELEGRAATTRPLRTGEHRSLSRRRGQRTLEISEQIEI